MAEIQKQTKLEQKKRIWHYKHFYVEHRVCVRCAVQIIINYISVLFLFFIHSIHSMLTQLSFLFVHSWHVKHTSFWSVCPTALFWAKQAYSKQSLWSFKTTKKKLFFDFIRFRIRLKWNVIPNFVEKVWDKTWECDWIRERFCCCYADQVKCNAKRCVCEQTIYLIMWSLLRHRANHSKHNSIKIRSFRIFRKKEARTQLRQL